METIYVYTYVCELCIYIYIHTQTLNPILLQPQPRVASLLLLKPAFSSLRLISFDWFMSMSLKTARRAS